MHKFHNFATISTRVLFVIELTFALCCLFLGVTLTLLAYLSAYQGTHTQVVKCIVLVVITIFASCQHAATHFIFRNLYRKAVVASINCKCVLKVGYIDTILFLWRMDIYCELVHCRKFLRMLLHVVYFWNEKYYSINILCITLSRHSEVTVHSHITQY